MCAAPNVCDCVANWYGSDCDTAICNGALETNPVVCGGHGTCVGSASPYCSCVMGYSGDDCELWSCYSVGNAEPSVCSGRGTCIALDSCCCDSGWTGPTCSESMGLPLFADGFESGDLSAWS